MKPKKHSVWNKLIVQKPVVFTVPREILLQIISYLQRNDRRSLRHTCKYMREVLDSPSVWTNRVVRVHMHRTLSVPLSEYYLWSVIERRNLRHICVLPDHENLSRVSTFEAIVTRCPGLQSIETVCHFITYMLSTSQMLLERVRGTLRAVTINYHCQSCLCEGGYICIDHLSKLDQLDNVTILGLKKDEQEIKLHTGILSSSIRIDLKLASGGQTLLTSGRKR